MTREDRRTVWRRMRAPVLSFVALMALLAVNVVLGATLPFRAAWMVEAFVLVCMVVTVLLVSMEVWHEPPLVRVFSALGFFWVLILFGMTLVDYLTR